MYTLPNKDFLPSFFTTDLAGMQLRMLLLLLAAGQDVAAQMCLRN